jgi:hypothetical protein
MLRIPSLLIAATVLTTVPAIAADTPNPSSGAEDALPSGSNAGAPSTPPPDNDAAIEKSAPATSPGEENKGKPSVNPQ